MLKNFFISISLSTLLLSNTIIEQKQFDLIQSIIPGTKIEKIKPGIVSGMYEAYFENGSLMYVMPDKRLLFIGEIYTNTGESLTQKSIAAYKAKNNIKDPLEQSIEKLKVKNEENKNYLKEIIDNGIKVGNAQNHKYKIVVFKSLTCPFCKKLDSYLKNKKNVTTYVYLAPSSETKDYYKKKFNISNPDAKIKKQGELIIKKLKGFGVPFALIIDDKYNLVDTIKGFDKTKWDKYINEKN